MYVCYHSYWMNIILMHTCKPFWIENIKKHNILIMQYWVVIQLNKHAHTACGLCKCYFLFDFSLWRQVGHSHFFDVTVVMPKHLMWYHLTSHFLLSQAIISPPTDCLQWHHLPSSSSWTSGGSISGKGARLVLVNHFAVSSGRTQREKKFCLLQSISKVVDIKCHTFYVKTSWVPHNKVAISTPGGIDLKLALYIIRMVCRELKCFWRE